MKRNSGFTLIEIMVTVSIAAIIISIAVPSYSAMIKSNRLTAGTNELVSGLLLARSEALKRSNSVTMCVSINQKDCANRSDYAEGWVVFLDCNGNGALNLTADNDCDNDGVFDEKEKVIKVHGPLAGLNISNNKANNKKFLRYTFAGRSAAVSFDVKLKSSSTIEKQIKTSMTGRVRTCTGVCP